MLSLYARIRRTSVWTAVLLAGCMPAASCSPKQEAVSIAVAANFTEPAKELAELFQKTTGRAVQPSFGSTGQLFAQITQDAPFEVFLAADQATPRKVVAAGLAAEDSLFTYAIGRVVLFSGSLDLSGGEQVLRDEKFEKIAIANPATAPYGLAAVEAMKALGLYDRLSPRFVQGNDIAQAFQFVETGNAELGFVAQSQVLGKASASVWIVPENLYAPIRQDAVMLKKAAGKETARAFVDFLKGAAAVAVIEKYGYQTGP
jgi:molybdate transport system substrate-binding protein